MLKLKKKPAVLGVINNRVEKHGDDDVTAFDIPVCVLLNPDDLDAFIGKDSHDSLFKKAGRGYEPRFPDFEITTWRHNLEDANITLILDKSEIEFEEARLKDLKLEFLQGGETSLKFKLQVRPKNQHLTRLLDAQNCAVKITVADAKAVKDEKDSAQQQLPITNVSKSKGENGAEASAAAH